MAPPPSVAVASSVPGAEAAYPEPSIRAAYGLISRACLGAGLSGSDADDLAQDLWEWLIRTGVPTAVIATPWLKRAVHHYILRFRRRSYYRRIREGQSLERAPEPQFAQPLHALESNQLLDRLATVLPRHERNLLALIRRGYSVAEAGRLLGIPRGSRAYHRARLIARARREMKRTVLLSEPRRGSDC